MGTVSGTSAGNLASQIGEGAQNDYNDEHRGRGRSNTSAGKVTAGMTQVETGRTRKNSTTNREGECSTLGSGCNIWCARQELNLRHPGSKAYSVVVCKPLILRLVNRFLLCSCMLGSILDR